MGLLILWNCYPERLLELRLEEVWTPDYIPPNLSTQVTLPSQASPRGCSELAQQHGERGHVLSFLWPGLHLTSRSGAQFLQALPGLQDLRPCTSLPEPSPTSPPQELRGSCWGKAVSASHSTTNASSMIAVESVSRQAPHLTLHLPVCPATFGSSALAFLQLHAVSPMPSCYVRVCTYTGCLTAGGPVHGGKV